MCGTGDQDGLPQPRLHWTHAPRGAAAERGPWRRRERPEEPHHALEKRRKLAAEEGRALNDEDIKTAIREGALLRVRPIVMTVAAIIISLIPIMTGTGTGSEVMRRIAAPMVGGIVSSTVLSLLVLPAVFLLKARWLAGR